MIILGRKKNIITEDSPVMERGLDSEKVVESVDVGMAPVTVIGDGKKKALIKVDAAFRFGTHVVVVGWRSHSIALALSGELGEIACECYSMARQDVAEHLGVEDAGELGFVLLAKHQDKIGELALVASADNALTFPLTLTERDSIASADIPNGQEVFDVLSKDLEPYSQPWYSVIAAMGISGDRTFARGFIETVKVAPATGRGIVAGWIAKASSRGWIWIEDSNGAVHSMKHAYRRYRRDVHDLFGADFPTAAQRAGFVVVIENVSPGDTLTLKSYIDGQLSELAHAQVEVLPNAPTQAAEHIFGLVSEASRLAEYCQQVALPILTPLVEVDRRRWADLPAISHALGAVPEDPVVSIIVPLYGGTQFLEHQLLEFARDPWLQEHAELIYVLDDQRLVEDFSRLCESLFALYRFPFRWIWGSANRGFSGANNLGATSARGQHLLFLNSDVFPISPGWLESMVAALESVPEAGLVGARLVFPDGSLQHAGMQFLRRDDLGVWINHHPCMGLDPALDPHQELSEVPAVSGACLLISRTVFDEAGGWDTGYLVGDFEDSDLCLNLLNRGLKVLYEPHAQLIHLERQSFKLLGGGDYRTRVTVLNAVRHQQRWSDLIEEQVND